MHIAVSVVISNVILSIFNSWTATLASLIAGIFIDLDHFLDYFIDYGVNFNFKKFYEVCREAKFKRIFLIFHSFELVIILWMLIYIMRLGIIWGAIAIGFTQHLLLDQFSNSKIEAAKMRYFFLYRFKKGFDKMVIVKDGKIL